MGLEPARTTATLTLLGVGLAVLLGISRPLRAWKVGLTAAMGGLYAVAMAWPFARDYFELVVPTAKGWAIAAVCTLVGAATVAFLSRPIGGHGDYGPKASGVDNVPEEQHDRALR